ncbi:MAG: nitrous oxide reductase accessory protein NosL [Sulfurimonas sp.]|nr:nitrous oxide reductase accessory protein NosL [Sulfurimonas sp.]
MVSFIKRDKNDIFNKALLNFFFKNKKFLMALRVVVAALFFYALYFGFAHPGKENLFTGALFWGIFWALFMVATLPSFGRIFCGICPHGFLGKYITRFGLKKAMPKWMQNRYIGITLLVIGWWGIYYTFPSFWKSPLTTAAMFSGMTLLAFVIYYIYKDMSYCKFICPIGTLTRAYDKLAFTKLETYTDECKDCRTFECATACSYNLKPFSFVTKNQADDCTLCMDCAVSCEAVKFTLTKPSQQLFSKFKTLNAEIWTYIFILGSIPISMSFAHGLNRTNIAENMIWNTTAVSFGMEPYAGGFAFVYALILTIFFSVLGLFLASKVLKKEYSSTFSTLGYGYAPLFILGSLGHTLESLFTKDSKTIAEGFAQAFGFVIEVAPLAQRGDSWLHYFGLLKWIGVVWALILIYKRLKLIEATKIRKIFGYFFASFLVLFFIGVNLYSGYVFKTYGAKQGGHGSHGAKEMFQSVPLKDAILLQSGKDKLSGAVCGMNLPKFYKTNHTATVDNVVKQYCSLHCLSEDLKINKLPLTDIKVVDVTSLQFIDVKAAFYVVGSNKTPTMSETSKYAFAKKEDAQSFAQKYGGEIMDFEQAMAIALKDFSNETQASDHKKKVTQLEANTPFYFTLSDPNQKDKGSAHGMHSHGSGEKRAVPTKKSWLVYGDDLQDKKLIPAMDIETFYYETQHNLKETKVQNSRGATSYSFEVPANGYYNLFAKNETLINGTLLYKVAKLEYLNASHGIEGKYKEEIKKTLHTEKIKIDLIKIKSDNENSFFYRNLMGDEIVFQALFDAKPLANAEIKIQMSSGWSKTIKTDDAGLAKFTLIKDYFPPWSAFDKRYKDELLLTLTHEQEDGAKYILTYPLSFSLNKDAYESYEYGLILLTLTLLISGFVIYRFRKNRTKPFRELSHEA